MYAFLYSDRSLTLTCGQVGPTYVILQTSFMDDPKHLTSGKVETSLDADVCTGHLIPSSLVSIYGWPLLILELSIQDVRKNDLHVRWASLPLFRIWPSLWRRPQQRTIGLVRYGSMNSHSHKLTLLLLHGKLIEILIHMKFFFIVIPAPVHVYEVVTELSATERTGEPI